VTSSRFDGVSSGPSQVNEAQNIGLMRGRFGSSPCESKSADHRRSQNNARQDFANHFRLAKFHE
jgi:hypothetical protein